MTLNISLSRQMEATLRQRAEAAGKDVEAFVRQVIEDTLSTQGVWQPAPHPPGGRDQWLAMFDAWVRSHPRRPNVHLDDSREHIYGGRGE